jgi:hypothetical protein
MITQQLIFEYFEYRDGNLYWKKSFNPNKTNLIGQLAGSIHKTGYQHITWMGKSHKAHRLIFMFHHGYMPDFIDHINNVRNDNRIENLRAATRSENNFNASMCKNNKSGYRGVNWHKHSKSWIVRVMTHGKSKIIGYFKDLELAGLVADEARALHHGKFAYNSASFCR